MVYSDCGLVPPFYYSITPSSDTPISLQTDMNLDHWLTEIATGVSSDDEELGNIHLYCVL